MARQKATANLQNRIITRSRSDSNVVKSAQRVFEILEFFDDYRQEATVVQIAESLRYPQSSTSALLKSLVALGYLRHDPVARTYISSPRVALLGSWVSPSFSRDGELIEVLHKINDQTGNSVVLMARNGLFVQYIYVLQAKDPAARRIGTGHLRPLATSGAGLVHLSTLADNEVVRLVMRINSEAERPEDIVNTKDLLAKLTEVRRVGYSQAFAANANCAIVAAPLMLPRQQPLTIGVCGEKENIRERSAEIGALLIEEINRFAGRAPSITPSSPTIQRQMSAAPAGAVSLTH